MLSFFANLFGYILNGIYLVIKNYGLAIILFSILIKLFLLPLSIKQQKTMKKSAKLQEKMKEIQFKYKNNPEKLNQETMNLYKSENMSPFSGCLSAIVQLVLLFSVFYLVRSPLTYMKKVDSQLIENYANEIKQEMPEEFNSAYPEISIIQHKGAEDERVYLNMDFLGIDLSKVPTQDLNDPRVYIIPVLYVISSFISMKITANAQVKKNEKKDIIIEGETEETKQEMNEVDAVAQANKSMSYIMPIMSISIAIVAPLGLALYWLMSNILLIFERLILDKYFNSKEEEENA